MCVVSSLGDSWRDRIFPQPPAPKTWPATDTYTFVNGVSQAEFDALRKRVEQSETELRLVRADLKKLGEALRAGRVVDEFLGEPDCENDEKIELIRRVCDLVGVDPADVVG